MCNQEDIADQRILQPGKGKPTSFRALMLEMKKKKKETRGARGRKIGIVFSSGSRLRVQSLRCMR